MSVVVRIGDEVPAERPRVAPARRALRGRDRWMIAAGAVVGLLLLAALPLPRIREARAQRERCATLEEQVERARADAEAMRAWESGEREQAPALHAEYDRWFASGEKLRELRDALRKAARTAGVQIISIDRAEAAGDSTEGAFAIPTTREVLGIAGRGDVREAARLAAMLPTLDPPLRLMTLEFTGPTTTRAFKIVAERFHEQPKPESRQGDRR